MDQEAPQINTTHVQSEPEMKEISEDDWNQMFKKMEIKKQYMDLLIMDFLAINNLPGVAETFHQESGCPLDVADFSHTKSQNIVKQFILQHQSDEAINLLNNRLGFSFLKDRPQIRFRLEAQKLIDLCYRRDFRGAYAFTPEFLMWAHYDDFRDDCYQTVNQLFSGNVNENPSSHLTDFLKVYCLAMDTVEEMISLQGQEPDCLIDRAMETLRLVEYELNQVIKFPNFNSETGYPEQLPFFDGIRDWG